MAEQAMDIMQEGIEGRSRTGVEADSGPYLRMEGLTKRFGDFTAVRKVSLAIGEGEFVCFLGPSGCGKTTLLRLIAGLEIPSEGHIWQAGREITFLAPQQRDFGIVFQSYALFPNLSVFDNVAFPLRCAKVNRKATRKRVNELLGLVGLEDQAVKYPAQLSGGQQQRVALARALAISPGLLLLDEPLSALDARVRAHLRHEVKALQERLGVTTIMVTHDQEEALTMAGRIVVMKEGRIEQVGTPEDIYRRPASLFVADFVGETNRLSVTTAKDGARIGEVHLACDTGGLAAGARAVAVIRPESLEVLSSDTEAENIVSGHLAEAEFLGNHWRLRIAVAGLGEEPLVAQLAMNEASGIDLTPGAKMRLGLPAESIRLFSDGGGGRT